MQLASKSPPDFSTVSKHISYDCASGEFKWIETTSNRVKAGSPAGCLKKTGYVVIGLLGYYSGAHRFAWLLHTGSWPSGEIDHIDGDPSNNRISNLRDVDRQTNCQNIRIAHKTNKSTGMLGVEPIGNRFRATVWVNGKNIRFGRYDTPELAHAAYLAAKRRLHDGCTI